MITRYKRVGTRYRRVAVRVIATLIPQHDPEFYQPSKKDKAKAALIKKLKAQGFDSIRFDEKQSGRIFILAWHPDHNMQKS